MLRAPPWAPPELRRKSAAEAGNLAASKHSTRPLFEYRAARAKMSPLRDSKGCGRNVWPRRGNGGDSHRALMLELSITQKTEVGRRRGKLRHVAWARPARGRGNVGAIAENLRRVNWGELVRWAHDRGEESYGRTCLQFPASALRPYVKKPFARTSAPLRERDPSRTNRRPRFAAPWRKSRDRPTVKPGAEAT